MKKNLIFYFFCFISGLKPYALFCQDVQLYGAIPSVLVKKSMNDRLEYAFNLSSETNLISRTIADRSFPAEVLNLNLETALSYDFTPNINLAGAILFRLNSPFNGTSFELRPWQQITFINRLEKYRIRNRFRAEQRWVEQQDGQYGFNLRLRYRLSSDFPLQGEQLDNKEWYLNVSSEAVITATASRPVYFWENRTYLGLGYRINDRNRIEPALEFRTRKTNAMGNRRQVLFLRLVWIADLSSN